MKQIEKIIERSFRELKIIAKLLMKMEQLTKIKIAS